MQRYCLIRLEPLPEVAKVTCKHFADNLLNIDIKWAAEYQDFKYVL